MPLESVALRPGINKNATELLNAGGWSASQFIRFREGWPEMWGGWQRYVASSLGSVIRRLHAWQDLSNLKWLAAGCEDSLTVIQAGLLYDITPQVRGDDVAPDFSTTLDSTTVVISAANSDLNIFSAVDIRTPVSVGGLILQGLYPVTVVASGTIFNIAVPTAATATVANGGAVPIFTTTLDSAVVEVELEGHGSSVGSQWNFRVPTTVGGIVISGIYTVFSVTDPDNFTVVAASAATSNDTQDMNGGDVDFLYYIGAGPAVEGGGWGTGPFGGGAWGTGEPPPYTPGSPIDGGFWSLDNWGEILLASPENGPIYQWRPNSGFTAASVIPQGPIACGGMFVAMPQQMIVAWAAADETGIQDPLLVRWCAVSDFNTWTGSATNQAGRFRLGRGSKIVGGMQGPNSGFLWTDLGVWVMNYIGSTLVWGFTEIGKGCGLIGRNAYCEAPDGVYWMGKGNFYRVQGGGVQTLPCTIWRDVFQNLDTSDEALAKITAGANSDFSEVQWHFVSLDSPDGEPDMMAKFNLVEGSWDLSPLGRTAWIDKSVLGNPIGAGIDGMAYYVWTHEDGYDADGQPINSYIESGDFLIGSGDPFTFIKQVYPDFFYGTAADPEATTVLITLEFREYPKSTPRVLGPYPVTALTEYIEPEARGRLMRIKVECNDQNKFWRLGRVRYLGQPDGRGGGV